MIESSHSWDVKATLQELTKAALRLPDEQKSVLAERLVGSVVLHATPSLKSKQLAEVMRRRERVLSGKSKGIPAERAIREIQALLQ